jgi:hypothetical protein
MMQELERVVLQRDVPDFGLAVGDVGTIVHAYADGLAFEVEFVALSGETVAVVTVPVDAVRAIRPREIANARKVA